MSASELTPLKKKIYDFSQQEIQSIQSIKYIIPQYAKNISLSEWIPSKKSDTYFSETLPYNDTDTSVQSLLKHWLENPCTYFCLLLGDYGMGKTISCMVLTRYILDQIEKKPQYSSLPIYMDLRSIRDEKNIFDYSLEKIIQLLLENSISSGETAYGTLKAHEIIHLVQKENAVIIFDGLDEVLVNFPRTQSKNFVQNLLGIIPASLRLQGSKNIGRVLLSCRTHFFKSTQDQQNYFLSENKRINLKSNDYTLFVMCPLSKHHIKNYLAHTIQNIEIEKFLSLLNSINNLTELLERPYILSLMPHLIPFFESYDKKQKNITGVTIYRHVILSCFERDNGKHTISAEHKMILMECFSADLWRSGQYHWTITHIEQWFSHWIETNPSIRMHYIFNVDIKENTNIIIEMLLEDLIAATLLVRTGDADFCFSHTSLQEFFLASYLYRSTQEGDVYDWDMPVVSTETLDFLGQLWSEEETPNLDRLISIKRKYYFRISELAFAYMMLAHTKNYPTPSMEGICLNKANFENWTIAGKENKLLNLAGSQFNESNLNNSNLQFLNLDKSSFHNAQLQNIEFLNIHAPHINFKNTNLFNSLFRESNLQHSNFENSILNKTRWIECDFRHSNLKEIIAPHDQHATFLLCQPENINYIKTNSEKAVTFNYHTDHVNGCSFSFDGLRLASSSWDQTVRIWDVNNGTCLSVFAGHEARVRGCKFSPQGYLVVSASDDKTLRLWDTQNNQCLKVFKGHQDRVKGCDFSPDGQYIISGSNDRTIRMWDVKTGLCLKILTGHDGIVRECLFSSDGRYIASSSEDCTLRLWDAKTGACLKIFSGHKAWVQGCTFSPDGHYLLSASGDKTIRLWDIASGTCIQLFKGHHGRIRACAFFPDGQKILSASDDKTLRIWDIQTGACLQRLHHHQAEVKWCVFSPTSHQFASASADHTLAIWDTHTGSCIRTLGEAHSLTIIL